jgi:short chain dehydrogenase
MVLSIPETTIRYTANERSEPEKGSRGDRRLRINEATMRISNNTILITGGTSGIGLELATQLLALGNTVIITGRDQAKLDRIKRDHPLLHTNQSDVSDPKAIASLYERVSREYPALNILINNAGVMRKINLQDKGSDLEDISREIETNLVGPVRMVKQFLPLLKAQPSAAIVNVSSGLAFTPFPISPIYSIVLRRRASIPLRNLCGFSSRTRASRSLSWRLRLHKRPCRKDLIPLTQRSAP